MREEKVMILKLSFDLTIISMKKRKAGLILNSSTTNDFKLKFRTTLGLRNNTVKGLQPVWRKKALRIINPYARYAYIKTPLRRQRGLPKIGKHFLLW